MYVVTQENNGGAVDAVRDILVMYVNMAEDGRILHNADWAIRFDPLMYVDVVQDSAGFYYVNMDLLRTGSALAIVARYYSAWSEEQGVHAWKDTDHYIEAIRTGRLAHLPDIEAVLREHLSGRHAAPDDPWFDTATAELVESHVKSYFRTLTGERELSGRGPDDWTGLTSIQSKSSMSAS